MCDANGLVAHHGIAGSCAAGWGCQQSLHGLRMAVGGSQVQRGAVEQGELLGHARGAGGAEEGRALVRVPRRLLRQLSRGSSCLLQGLVRLSVPDNKL